MARIEIRPAKAKVPKILNAPKASPADPSGVTVTHHIRQSLYPGERGEEAVRRLSIQGNRLTLLAQAHEMGENHERRLVWERISRSPR